MGTGRLLAFVAITAAIVATEPLKKEVLNLPPLIHFTDVFNSLGDKEQEQLTELNWSGIPPKNPPGGYQPGGYPPGGYPPGGYPPGGYPPGGYPPGGYPPGGYPPGGYPPGGYPPGGYPPGGYPPGGFPPGGYPPGGYPPGGYPPGGNPPGGYPPGGYPPGGYPPGGYPPGGYPPGGYPPGGYPPGGYPPGGYPPGGYPPYCYPQPRPPPPIYPKPPTYPQPGIPPIKPPYRQQEVDLVERYCKFNDDGSKEYKLVLSNGLNIYQKVLNKNGDKQNVQFLEGYYSDKRDDNTYLTTYFRADEKGYSASSEITDSPPSFPNVKEMMSLPLPASHSKQKH